MTDWPTLLRETRDRLGLSQVQLAEALGVSRQTIENWEGGHTKPALPEITRRALDGLLLAEKLAGGRRGDFYDEDVRLLAMAHGWEDTLDAAPMAEVVADAEKYLRERGLLPSGPTTGTR